MGGRGGCESARDLRGAGARLPPLRRLGLLTDARSPGAWPRGLPPLRRALVAATLPAAWWFSLLDLSPNDAVVEFGCGEGFWLRRLSQIGHRGPLSGIDLDAPSIRKARTHASQEGVRARWVVGDAIEDGPALGPAAAVILVAVLRHEASREPWFDAVWRTLRPGGRMLIIEDGEAMADLSAPTARADELLRLGWAGVRAQSDSCELRTDHPTWGELHRAFLRRQVAEQLADANERTGNREGGPFAGPVPSATGGSRASLLARARRLADPTQHDAEHVTIHSTVAQRPARSSEAAPPGSGAGARLDYAPALRRPR